MLTVRDNTALVNYHFGDARYSPLHQWCHSHRPLVFNLRAYIRTAKATYTTSINRHCPSRLSTHPVAASWCRRASARPPRSSGRPWRGSRLKCASFQTPEAPRVQWTVIRVTKRVWAARRRRIRRSWRSATGFPGAEARNQSSSGSVVRSSTSQPFGKRNSSGPGGRIRRTSVSWS